MLQIFLAMLETDEGKVSANMYLEKSHHFASRKSTGRKEKIVISLKIFNHYLHTIMIYLKTQHT